MNKSIKIYIALLVLLFIAIIYVDSRKQKPIDWTPSYSIKDKNPLGLFVFDREIGSLLKGQKIAKFGKTPYEYLQENVEYPDVGYDEDYDNNIQDSVAAASIVDSVAISNDTESAVVIDTTANNYTINGTILNIADVSEIDETSTKELLKFVSKGNNAFISAEYLPDFLLDSLKIETKTEFDYKDSLYNWVANPKLGEQKYKIIEGIGNKYFSKIDTLKTTVLGYQSGDSTRVNFIKVKFNEGNIFLHTQPAAFTNFHLLKGNHYQYAQKILSYIPKGNIFWYLKDQQGNQIDNSPLSYIHSQPALQTALMIFLIGMLFFMIFNARRKQRIVPIIDPLPNTTVDFTKTIGNLYYQEGDHDNIINKKIIYFLEKIRNEYLMDTSKLDEEFIKKLHQKSGKNLADIQRIVFLINAHRKSPHNSVEEDLIAINKAIEKVI
jgi:hypothetical protein